MLCKCKSNLMQQQVSTELGQRNVYLSITLSLFEPTVFTDSGNQEKDKTVLEPLGEECCLIPD